MAKGIDGDRGQTAAGRVPVGHPPIKPARIGVLLLNLGTPDATDYWSMRRYLRQFLSDRRVIDTNPLLWQPLLNLVILSRGLAQRARLCRDLEHASGTNRRCAPSPAASRKNSRPRSPRRCPGCELRVDWAMRYGSPATGRVIRDMIEAGCTRLLLVRALSAICRSKHSHGL